MIQSLYQFLYGSSPAEFKSAFELEESIDRLRAVTKRWAWSAQAQPTAVGPVDESKVRLQRVIPMVRNGSQPCFTGRFEVRPDGVYLSGRFTMLPFVKAFMTIGLGGTILIGILGVTSGQAWQGPFITRFLGFAMTAFGIGVIAIGKWFSRNDAAWLSHVIRSALGAPEPSEATATRSVPIRQETPTALRGVAGVVALGGAANLFVAIGAWMPKGPDRSLFGNSFFRTFMAITGVAMIVAAVGIYQRRIAAWRLGFALLAAVALITAWQVVVFAPDSLPTGVKVAESAGMLLVVGFWARWWHAQRIHFA